VLTTTMVLLQLSATALTSASWVVLYSSDLSPPASPDQAFRKQMHASESAAMPSVVSESSVPDPDIPLKVDMVVSLNH
jgi:hypothetical protein